MPNSTEKANTHTSKHAWGENNTSTPGYRKERVSSRGPAEQTGLLSKSILLGQWASSTFFNNSFDLHKSSGLKGLFRWLLSVLVTLPICVIKLLTKSAEERKGLFCRTVQHSAHPVRDATAAGAGHILSTIRKQRLVNTLVLSSSEQDPGREWPHPQWLSLPTSGNKDSSLQASSEAGLLGDFRFC